MVFKLEHAADSPGGLVRAQKAGPTCRATGDCYIISTERLYHAMLIIDLMRLA